MIKRYKAAVAWQKLLCAAVFLAFFLQVVAVNGQQPFEIPYSAKNIDVSSYHHGLILDITGDDFYIQDLIAKKLIISARHQPEKTEVIDFPESLLSIYMTGREAFALTREGVARYGDMAELIASLKNGKLEHAKVLVLAGAKIGYNNNDYRLSLDRKGNYALWNRPASRLLIFDKSGKLTCSYPCPSRPLLTDRDSFISVYFSPQFGSKIMEIAYAASIKAGRQIENDTLFVDVRGNRQFKLLSHNASDTFFTGILRPAGEQKMPPVMYVKVNENSTIEKIADLPPDFYQDELCLGSGTFSYLQPRYYVPEEQDDAENGVQIEKLVIYSVPYADQANND